MVSVGLSSATPVSAQQFSTEEATREVEENTRSFSAIGGPVRATGGGNLTYTLENAGTSHFAIDSSTGQLMAGAPLDYESEDSYTVKVIASDGKSSGSITVTVNVTNLDERGSVTLSWKQPQVSTEITASLTDPDGGVSGLTWQWSRADTKNGSYSDVNAATLASYTPVDDDVDKFLRATASYTDGEGSGKSARMESYRDVRAAPSTNSAPAFPEADDISGGYDCSGTDPDRGVCLYVRRSSPVGAEIYNPARATDPDGDEVRYSLEGTDAAAFRIDGPTGRLYTKQLFRDVDTSSYTVTIKARDPSGASDAIKATITPSGSKGVPVVEGPEEISYAENGTWQVATYTAENKHGPTGGWIVSVQPGGGDGDHFTINDEGVLTFDSPPDFEDPKDEGGNNSYNFSIMAYESNPPNGQRPRQTILSVTVIVTDVAVPEPLGTAAVDVEEAPEFAASEADARTVPENTPAGQDIGSPVAATDGDGDSLTYTLGGTDGGSFDIVSASGQLLTKDPVDYETKSSYSVTVSVRDNKDAKGDADTATDATVTVTVTVANLEEPGTLELSATHPLVDTALTASLTDPDGSISGESWVWESSSDRSNWTAISGATGDSYTPVDGDVGSYLRVTASYTDGEASGKTAQAESANTVVTAPPANRDPAFSAETTTRQVTENTPANRNVGSPVAATDDDNDTLQYTLGGDDASSFNIVATSGQLRTKDPLDYETKSGYSVTVSVRDSKDADGNADTETDDTITVTISVADVDESPRREPTSRPVSKSNQKPFFNEGDNAQRSVAENANAVTDIGEPIKASDSDNDKLTYTLGGVDGASFDIAKSSGQLQTKTSLDHEDKSSYEVTVTVKDPSNASDRITVTITVTDVEESPAFPADEDGARNVAENTGAGEDIGDPVAAEDNDGDSLTYTLGGDDAASFDIVASTGQLQTKAALDHESKPSHSVTVSVSDGYDTDGNSDTVVDDTISLTITVTNVHESPEFPAGEDGARSVAENTGAGEDIGDPVAATAGDWDSLTYALGGDDAASFDIVASTGQLQTKGALDYDTKSSYSVTVSVSDGYDADGNSDAALDDTIDVTITVINLEESPEFPAGEDGARSVAENTGAGEDIGDPVVAMDSDGDSMTYTLGGDDAASFDIVASTGQLQTKATLDHEDKSSYSVTVSTSDGYDADRNVDTATDDTIAVTIMVADVEETPVFPATETGARSAAENTGAGEDIGDPVTAEDDDGDPLTYTLGGDDAASFDIVSATGQLQTKAALDYEDKSSYSVTVSVSDGYDADGNSDTATDDTITVTITVTDVEEVPEFPAAETGTRSVAENTAAWERIGDAVEAEDDDGDSLTYTLGGSDAASFDMVASTGRLRTRALLDYESKSSYSVTVSVSDGYDADGNADTATDDTITVTIAVTDMEEDPEFPADEDGIRSVAENTPAGEDIGDPVAAEDDDGDSLTYTLGGDDAGSFDIVGSTGQLRTKAALDYDTKSSYSVTVLVSDGYDADGNGDTATDDTITVTITVTDVEEDPEFPADEDGIRSVAENTPAGEDIGDPVAAEDDDGDSLTYTLGGDDAGSFDIVGSTGQLRTKAALDYDTKSSYSVTVSVSDGYDADGSSDTAVDDTISVTITVTNLEESPEFPPGEDGARSVAENTAAGEDIGDPLAAFDSDGDSMTYTLGGDDAASFDIVAATGQLQTKAALDHEEKSSYSVTVSVSDGYDADRTVDTAADDTITVTIMVADVEETSAFPATETGARSAAENTGAGEDIGDPVMAEDDDGDSLTYTLGGDDAASFDIVASTGQLQTKAALDYEDKSSYSVTVWVSDGYDAHGNSDTATDDTITVTITVTDVEESPAFPADEDGVRSVAENTAAWERIGDAVEAEDDDGDSLTYTLGGSDAASFDIVASPGRLRTRAPLDYEIKSSYSVTVSVNDGYDAEGNADTATDDTVAVTITVTDVEEEGEVALSSVQPQVGRSLTASITDPDGGVSGATWEWESSSDNSDWESIDGATGPSYTPVAGDVGNYLRATAAYSDRRGSSKEAQEVSANTVRAAPVTNSAPDFGDDSVDREVAEHTEPGENIGEPVVAADEDDDPLTYTLGGSDDSSFDITASTGQLLTKAFPDYESKSSYTVTVTATDPSGAADSVTVSISVTDVAAPIGASTFPFIPGGDIPVFAAGNARALDIKEAPPWTLVAIIMMFVGALMIAVGSYLRTWASRPQRPDYGRDRGFHFPAFSPAPAD